MTELSPSGRTDRQDAVNAHKRALILEAARRVFEADGLDGASLRAIARAAGYTAGAIYFHFPSKETIYAAVLEASLDRLIAAVDTAVEAVLPEAPADRLAAAALAFFDFYAANPRDLELGFYLYRGGLKPRGLSPELDEALNARLLASLAPIGVAARALGAGEAEAQALTAELFGHAVGLLLLVHTGRIRLFPGCGGAGSPGAAARALMAAHLERCLTGLTDPPG